MKSGDAPSVPPAVHDLRRLVDFQSGSVISRVLARGKGGTVTLFAFDEGEGLSEHTAPFDALVIGIEGRGEIEIAGVSHSLAEQQMLSLPARVPHAVRAPVRFKMLLVMLRA